MITPDMVVAIKVDGCRGCVFDDMHTHALCHICAADEIYKLKREYKPHYRTPPANYRDSENE